jgi:hypothetical protein
MFKVNEGPIDRGIRIAVGIIALIIGMFVLTGVIKIILVVIGLIALITGIFGFCGLYVLLGINTCPIKKEGY